MDKNLIAKRIRLYRHLEKLSQEALAYKIGKSDTYIRKMESGDRIPSLGTVMKLAAAFHTTPDHLLLPSPLPDENPSSSIMKLLNDCTPSEIAILYDNMLELKTLLRKYYK